MDITLKTMHSGKYNNVNFNSDYCKMIKKNLFLKFSQELLYLVYLDNNHNPYSIMPVSRVLVPTEIILSLLKI